MAGVTHPQRGEIWWVSLDPTQGSEIKKTRPCLVVTSDVLNRHRNTVVVIPLSTAAKANPPITLPVICQGKTVVAVIDQIRAVAKHRLKKKIETVPQDMLEDVLAALAEILEI